MKSKEILEASSTQAVTLAEMVAALQLYASVRDAWASDHDDDELVDMEYLLNTITEEMAVTPVVAIALARRVIAFYNTAAEASDILEMAERASADEALADKLSNAIATAPFGPHGEGEDEVLEVFDLGAFRRAIST